jgi:hypothetical protein
MEFGDAHLCHASEYLMSNSATPIPAGGAWLDSSVTPDGAITQDGSHRFGRITGSACQNYTTALSAYQGTVLLPNGEPVFSSTCGTAKPLACCNGEPKIVFAGFTPTTTMGNLGGRPAAHSMCGAAFPGAHLCHAAEYLRTNSPVTIPAAGAWLDSSITDTGEITQDGGPSFGRITGSACQNYTTTLSAYQGTVLLPNGEPVFSSTCGTARSLACCY